LLILQDKLVLNKCKGLNMKKQLLAMALGLTFAVAANAADAQYRLVIHGGCGNITHDRFTPEQAHHIILSNLDWATQLGAQKLVTRSFPENPIEIMGLRFPNCVGLAAGMDKDGEHVTAFGALGFGSVEIGTVTPKGQPASSA
jgi:hypothetical protein